MPKPINHDQMGNRVQIYSQGMFHHGTVVAVTMGEIKLQPYIAWNSANQTHYEVNEKDKFANIPNFPVPPVVPITDEHYQSLLENNQKNKPEK